MGINLKSLISKLNDTSRIATERAASLCMSRGQYEVDLEHLFLALLETPQSDFSLIARRNGISIDSLQADLENEINHFKNGNTRTPVLSPHLQTLFEHGWLIASLDAFNVRAERREDRVGVWVRRPEKGPLVEDKIAAIGIRVRRWVSLHGLSLNVEPDLSHFSGIVPCGVREHGVTSLADLGRIVSLPEVDMALRAAFEPIFGETRDEA